MSLPSEQVCKGCSLVVQPGYPKCPRCKMPLPKFEAPLATMTKASQVQGGTAIEEESNSNVLLIGGALLLAGGLITVLVMRGDDSKPSDEDLLVAPVDQPSEATADVGAPTEAEIGISTEPEELSKDDQRADAIAKLDEELSGARLWATVSADASVETTISVVSNACEQDDMQPTLRAAAGPLKEAGFTTVVCVAKHGALVFELDL